MRKQNDVRDELERGKGIVAPTWSSAYLEGKQQWALSSDTEGAYVVGMNAITSALTISVVLQSFCLALVLQPEWQKKVQEEIDTQVGERMPMPADSQKLPTLCACIRETFRWRPPVPMGRLTVCKF